MQTLRAKHTPVSRDGKRALVYRPHHLAGAETVFSVLNAVLRLTPSAAPREVPVAEAITVMKTGAAAGTLLPSVGSTPVSALAASPREVAEKNLLPIAFAPGSRLRRAVKKGDFVAVSDVVPPENPGPLYCQHFRRKL